MNKAEIATIAKQHRQYQTEANAKRRNLLDFPHYPQPRNAIANALALTERSMMIVRTEAKAKAIEELAEALGIAEQVAALVEEAG